MYSISVVKEPKETIDLPGGGTGSPKSSKGVTEPTEIADPLNNLFIKNSIRN